MLVYWSIFAIFATAALLWKDQRSWATHPQAGEGVGQTERRSTVPRMVGLFLLLVIGLRYRVGGDWSNYAFVYTKIEYLDWGQAWASSQQEFAYTLINWISAQVGGGLWLVNLLSAIPFTIGLIRLSQRLGNTALALAIATPFLIIVVGMGYTRQAAALGFLMIGLVELIERKSLRRFIAYVLIGSLFHRTILIFIPILMIGNAKTLLGSLALAGLAIPVVYFTLIRATLERYSAGYIQGEVDSQGALIRIAMNLLPAILLLLSGNRLYRSLEEKSVWRTLALLAVLGAPALWLVQSSSIVDRLSIYLIPLQLFVYTRIAEQASSTSSSRLTARALIILYSAAVMFIWLNYAVHARLWLPYRNYLFE